MSGREWRTWTGSISADVCQGDAKGEIIKIKPVDSIPIPWIERVERISRKNVHAIIPRAYSRRLSLQRSSYRFFSSSNRLANASNSSTGSSPFVFGSEPSTGGMSGSLGTFTSASTFAFTLSNTSFSFFSSTWWRWTWVSVDRKMKRVRARPLDSCQLLSTRRRSHPGVSEDSS